MTSPTATARRLVPRHAIAALALVLATAGLGVRHLPVTFDAPAATTAAPAAGPAWAAADDLGSLASVADATRARDAWITRGLTGKGVDVALVDSGVVPVEGLATTDKVVAGPDLSPESHIAALRQLDTFGHGTHMAGIIAGRDSLVRPGHVGEGDHFVGIAPDARIVNVKVAASDGSTDIARVIAAIDWIVQHRDEGGKRIRVLSLSFSTAATQSYLVDPLARAVENAWHHGIVTVVAAGNEGAAATLASPAIDPYVIAVGASDNQGTRSIDDDTIAAFSSAGDAVRHADLLAPGKSIVSLRNPGSYVDQSHHEGRVAGDRSLRFFRGTGTSQATAVVSGAVALLLQARPELTPDQVKELLVSSARPLAASPGAGLLDVIGALDRPARTAVQSHPRSTGTGPVVDSGNSSIGDAFDRMWSGNRWSGNRWSGNRWSGNRWSGNRWSGNRWSGNRWSGNRWSGNRWSGNRWSGNRWSGNRWSGNRWSGNRWSGNRWSGNRWS